MSQTRRTLHFARSVRRGEEKNKAAVTSLLALAMHAMFILKGELRANYWMRYFTAVKAPKHIVITFCLYLYNKTLWELIYGRGRSTGMILCSCHIAAKQLSSYLTREGKSFTPLVCWTTQLIQYVDPIHNKNRVISRQCLKIWTSSMQTCLEPNCNIGHKWLQPGE